LLTAVFAVVVVRRTLRPLAVAAQSLDNMAGYDRSLMLDVGALPRETVGFGLAINRLLCRVGALIASEERLVSRTAHTLRTSLAIVMLELGKLSDPIARRIESDVSAMRDTIQRLLVLARIETLQSHPNREMVDLVGVARRSIDHLRAMADARKSTVSLLINEPLPVRGDAEALVEALGNLVENAIKHALPGATIKVTCGPGRRMSVDDSGPGINEADTGRLFEPFERGQTSAEGTGLGLAIVRDAVTAHHGTITVERSSLGGARISLDFG
jgi:signal transduction histidine kinase